MHEPLTYHESLDDPRASPRSRIARFDAIENATVTNIAHSDWVNPVKWEKPGVWHLHRGKRLNIITREPAVRTYERNCM